MARGRDYTVIIPSKDRVEMLQESVASALGQSLAPACIHLVIDEPPDNAKYDFLRRYDSRIVVHFTGGGFGGARARNVGLSRVETPYVFFLDDDDIWLPQKVEMQIAALEAWSEWTGITCWRCEEQGTTRRIQRVSNWRLRNLGRVTNIVGSFSQFGMRVNERTRDLRLEPGLRSSQDFEFYLQLQRIGSIGCVREVLVRYRVITGPRITGSDVSKAETYTKVYGLHRDSLNRSERAFWHAQIASVTPMAQGSVRQRLGHFLRVVFSLLLSGPLILGGEPTFRRALAGLIRWKSRRADRVVPV